MTIFGTDISSYQNGLDLSRLTASAFVIAKTTEGTYYTDSGYQGWRRQAAVLHKPFVWYHFLSGEDAHAQVAHTKANLGDATLPGMLDVEPTGSFHPSLAQVLAYADAAHDAGLNLRLLYLPRWYWQQIGSPSLKPAAERGLFLVSSAYPGGTGSPAELYPGDSAPGWQSYGGMTPLLYQYTNQASDGGQALDYNAFRGSLQQFTAYLQIPTSTQTGGTTMGSIPPSIAHHFAGLDLSNDFPPNATFDETTALIWTDGRAEAAYRQAAINTAKLDQLLARPGAAAPAPVDVVALAAALAPLLHAGATADEVATAVVTHLEETLAKGTAAP